MDSWHSTFLGLRKLPCEISSFELQAFFTFSRRIGEAQLPAVDAQVRFSWVMLGREPKSADELLMVIRWRACARYGALSC